MEKHSKKSTYEMAIDNLSMPLSDFYQSTRDSKKPKNESSANLASSESSSSILNYSDKQEVNQQDWREFANNLNTVLDVYAFRNVDSLIEEFIKLEKYLNGEMELGADNENDLFFQNQAGIVDYLNKTVRTKLYRVSQSTSLFDELKLKTANILAKHLGETNLKEHMKQFEKLERKYMHLYDHLKSK
jgi:hypothetical protein